MTREEAIEFGNMWLEVNEDCKDSNTYEFFKIAVEELKKEPYEDVVKKDCGNCAYYDNGANDEACSGCFEDEEHLNFKPKEKTGHWIPDIDRWGDIVTTVNGYTCSECGKFNTDKDNYCPNCGIKMIERQENEK